MGATTERTQRELDIELHRDIRRAMWKRRTKRAFKLTHWTAIAMGYIAIFRVVTRAIQAATEWLSTLF